MTTTPPEPTAPRPDIDLMSATIGRVQANAQPGVNTHSGWLAAIRAGITPVGETTAIAQAAPYLSGLHPRAHPAALRAAAIRAINRDVPHSTAGTLGKSLARLAAVEGGSSIGEQVAVLPLMNVDAAALVLDGLIGRCARPRIPVNFYDLARTLIYWGDGASSKSSRGRNKIVLDFHLGAERPNAS